MTAVQSIAVVDKPAEGRLASSAVVRDVATMGAGTLLVTVLAPIQAFLIPRLVSVEDYGYWRLFFLYVGYAGFLHFGLADGALLRWAGRQFEDIGQEIAPLIKVLLWQHLGIIAITCLASVIFLSSGHSFVAIAIVVCALVVNLTTLLQYSLQAAKVFRPVAISLVAPQALFLMLVLAWEIFQIPDFRVLIVSYISAYCLVLLFIWKKSIAVNLRRAITAPLTNRVPLGKSLIRSGWPILLANTGFLLVQSADRLTVSWGASIQQFAQYSLAAAAVSVPITAIQPIYRVTFSHFAGVDPGERRRIYGSASRFLLMIWTLFLPYYFLVAFFVQRFLLKYIPSLPFARVLLLSVLFVGLIQVLQLSFSCLYGRQRRFLIWTTAIVILGLSFNCFAIFVLRSAFDVAVAQVVTVAIWWLLNEWKLRDLTGQGINDWIRIASVFIFVAADYWVSTALLHRSMSVLFYYSLALPLLLLACPNEVRMCARIFRRQHNPGVASS